LELGASYAQTAKALAYGDFDRKVRELQECAGIQSLDATWHTDDGGNKPE
jgi:hypothetical protein